MEVPGQRMESCERALRAAGIPVDPMLIVDGSILPLGDNAATHRLLDNGQQDGAIAKEIGAHSGFSDRLKGR